MSGVATVSSAETTGREFALVARKITKRFQGVTALNDLSFDLRAGEIHALCGENGAGKSTLIKILSGLHPHGSFDGDFAVAGAPARFHGAAEAERAGISVIYQELALVPQMSVAENIFLGAEPHRRGLIDHSQMRLKSRELLRTFGLKIDPQTPAEQLGVGEKQLVEIMRALRKRSQILILDEPTAALGERETGLLLGMLRELRAQGISCIYISHKLDEVFAIADRITVLRDGSAIATSAPGATSRETVIAQMVGRPLVSTPTLGQGPPAIPTRAPALFITPPSGASLTDPAPSHITVTDPAPALRVTDLSVADSQTGELRLHHLSFSVARGEVLGIAGLMGAGRTELLMHLFGAWGKRTSGHVELGGRPLPMLAPAQILRRGLALVTEDRRRYGLLLEESVAFNLSLSSLLTGSRCGFVSEPRDIARMTPLSKALKIKTPSWSTHVGTLSGGNQQKVVLGRVLLTDPQVVLLDEPTRGIDIGAKFEIYEIIRQLTAAGKAVIVVSSELPELLSLSDRILVLNKGHLAGEFTRAEATPHAIMKAALGTQCISEQQ